MKRLWAPWRIKYLQAPKPQLVTGCVFCEKIAQNTDRDNLLLLRADSSCIVMNLYPYNSGHLMVIPYGHVARIADVPPQAVAEMWSLVNRCVAALDRTIRPEGFNIGINMGKAAGAGVDEHIHLHVVPRWTGDTNFMTVLGDTRVVPETLLDTYDKLKAALDLR